MVNLGPSAPAILRTEPVIAEPGGLYVRSVLIGDQILAFLKEHGAKSVIATDSLIGCPHEEGIDYPEGKSCPRCPYWAGRDRFTRERIQ